MKRSALKRTTELVRKTPLRAAPRFPKRGPISPATKAQKALVRGKACLVCGSENVQPAHLIDRSLAPSAGDHPLAVVPLCHGDHRRYDDHQLDLLPYLETGGRYREHMAQAVIAVGFLKALKRITGCEWIAEEAA